MKNEKIKIALNKEIYEFLYNHFNNEDKEKFIYPNGQNVTEFEIEVFVETAVKNKMAEDKMCKFSLPEILPYILPMPTLPDSL